MGLITVLEVFATIIAIGLIAVIILLIVFAIQVIKELISNL